MTQHDEKQNTPPGRPFNVELWADNLADKLTRILDEGRNEQAADLATAKDWLEMRLDNQDRAISMLRAEQQAGIQTLKQDLEIVVETKVRSRVAIEARLEALAAQIAEYSKQGKAAPLPVIQEFQETLQQHKTVAA